MSVTHIVAFSFKAATPASQQAELRKEFLGLKHSCLKEGKPYIKDIIAGAQMSIENTTLKNVFVVTFNSVEDRTFYVREDEVHLPFSFKLKEVISESWVGDFINGAWGEDQAQDDS